MKHSVSVTCCALLVSSISLSYAAEVPSGTVLAEKQELVRHIKDEPASLDPAKAVGLPEIQVIRDLFEGLLMVKLRRTSLASPQLMPIH